MALLRIRQLRLILTNPNINRLFSDKVITLEIDPPYDEIDSFTSSLVSKNSKKWIKTKKKFNLMKESKHDIQVQTILFTNISHMNREELDKTFMAAIDEGNKENIENLLNQCVGEKCCPTLTVLMKIFDIYSSDGNMEMINKTKELAKEVDPVVYLANGSFDHYLAEAMWINGDVIKALDLLETTYRKNVYLRRRIRLILRYLIVDVTQRSEAVLVNIIRFTEFILKEYDDYFPLACVWQACFLSEWYTDQQMALELLERNDGLCKAVVNNIPYVVWFSLRNHQTEAIYRLLEILLKYDMKMQYSIVLIALFDYRFRQGNLKSCLEIIQWSVTHKVMLPTELHERFLMLLLNNKDESRTVKGKKQKPQDLDFKF